MTLTNLLPKAASSMLKLSVQRNAYILQMCHGDNQLCPELVQAMNSALDVIQDHYFNLPSTPTSQRPKALITTGQDKYYSNGVHMKGVRALSSAHTKKDTKHERQEEEAANRFMRQSFGPFLARLLTFPIPTVACINGHAFGGGLFMALCHDVRGMRSDRGYLCFNAIDIPVVVPHFLFPIARSKLGPGLFPTLSSAISQRNLHTPMMEQRDSFLKGKRWNAQGALGAEFVDFVAPSESLFDTTLHWVDSRIPHIASTAVYHKMKEDLYSKEVAELTKYL